jgi:hypothetical protein
MKKKMMMMMMMMMMMKKCCPSPSMKTGVRDTDSDKPLRQSHYKAVGCTLLPHCTVSLKGKFHPTTCHELTEGEQRRSYTLSLTSAVDGVGNHRNAPAALTPEITLYALQRRLIGP